MITVTVALGCDLPSCGANIQRNPASEGEAKAVARLRQDAAAAGWWVDAIGRAWCPTHRAKEPSGG